MSDLFSPVPRSETADRAPRRPLPIGLALLILLGILNIATVISTLVTQG